MDEYELKVCMSHLIDAQKAIAQARFRLELAGGKNYLHWFDLKMTTPMDRVIKVISSLTKESTEK